MALKKRNRDFRLEHSDRENRTTFSDVPLLPEIFHWNDPKSHVPFTFQQDFPGTFCYINGKQPVSDWCWLTCTRLSSPIINGAKELLKSGINFYYKLPLSLLEIITCYFWQRLLLIVSIRKYVKIFASDLCELHNRDLRPSNCKEQTH